MNFKIKNSVALLNMCVFALFCILVTSSQVNADNKSDVVLNSQVQWSPLNPARGDKSPQAGQLWGDRTIDGASGFLVKFADGFSSPPHIHNVTYRGVVISGLVHNDDPRAKNMWLPAGSFWTQPAGEAHITAAQGKHNVAYIEIENGPYLVKPESEAFDNGERPVNVDQSNLVWLDSSDVKWVKKSNDVQLAFLWGKIKDKHLNGTFLKLPEGFEGSITNNGSDFRSIIISGEVAYLGTILDAGSYFGAQELKKHRLSSEKGAVIYIRTNGKYDVEENK